MDKRMLVFVGLLVLVLIIIAKTSEFTKSGYTAVQPSRNMCTELGWPRCNSGLTGEGMNCCPPGATCCTLDSRAPAACCGPQQACESAFIGIPGTDDGFAVNYCIDGPLFRCPQPGQPSTYTVKCTVGDISICCPQGTIDCGEIDVWGSQNQPFCPGEGRCPPGRPKYCFQIDENYGPDEQWDDFFCCESDQTCTTGPGGTKFCRDNPPSGDDPGSCDASTQQLCLGQGDFENVINICCPTGPCHWQPNGVPYCDDDIFPIPQPSR